MNIDKMTEKRSFFALNLLNNSYPPLHGLRVLAIFSIIMIHVFESYADLLPKASATIRLLSALLINSFYGMDLFFILSGFLIGMILLHELKEADYSIFRNFYLRRAFRILPLYYFVLFTYWLSVGRINWFFQTELPEKLYFNELFYLTNYPFQEFYLMKWSWSLSLEEHFYLIAPAAILFLRKKPPVYQLTILFFLWVLAPILRLFALLSNSGWSKTLILQKLYTPTHLRYDVVVAGLVLAILFTDFRPQLDAFVRRKWLRRSSVALSMLIFASITSIDWIVTLLEPLHFLRDKLVFLVFAFGTLTSVAYCILIVWLLCWSSFVSRFLSSKIFFYLATLGYGVYLVHFPVSWIITKSVVRYRSEIQSGLVIDGLLISFMAICVSVFFAYVLHLTIEKPFLKWREAIMELKLVSVRKLI